MWVKKMLGKLGKKKSYDEMSPIELDKALKEIKPKVFGRDVKKSDEEKFDEILDVYKKKGWNVPALSLDSICLRF